MQAGSPDSNHEPEPAVSQSPVPPSLRQPKDESGNMDAQMRLPVPKLQSHAKDADVQVGVRPMPTSGQHAKQDSHPESLSARPQSFLFDEESDPIAEANAQLNLELRQLRSKESISSKHAIPKFADRVMHVHIPALDDQHVWRTLAVTYKAGQLHVVGRASVPCALGLGFHTPEMCFLSFGPVWRLLGAWRTPKPSGNRCSTSATTSFSGRNRRHHK